jgi:GNAT superfamily N-acetyltransferase
MTIEVRDFDGDAEALSTFVVGAWRRMYESSGVVLLWTADYLRWQLPSLAFGSTEEIIAAYEDSRLVGVYPAEVVPMRLRGEDMIATASSWLTVDPDFLRRGIGNALLEGVRRFNVKVGGMFNAGFINQGTIGGKGRAFWAASPCPVTMYNSPRMWVRVLDWRTLASAMWTRLDRMSAIVSAAMPARPIRDGSSLIRPYQAADLDSCHLHFQKHMQSFDLAYRWDRNRLGHHLGFGEPSHTLVLDGAGGVEGYVNLHILDALGRRPFRVGIVDGLAPGSLAAAKATALLDAALGVMRKERVTLATVLGPAVHPRSVLLRCGFLPPPSTYKLILIEMQRGKQLSGLRRIYTHLR